MRKFGLIGGLSWLSTIDYYRELNKSVNQHFDSNVNPPLHLINLNQNEIHGLQKTDDWQRISQILLEAGKELQSVGCQGIAFCANTPHRVFDIVQADLDITILHIGDAIGEFAKKLGYKKIGLLGTQYTMEGDFLKNKLTGKYGLDVLTPDIESRVKIQTAVSQELSHGVYSEATRNYFLSLIESFKAQGAEAVILGCTEFPILLKNVNSVLPTIDSTMCHVKMIRDFILS